MSAANALSSRVCTGNSLEKLNHIIVISCLFIHFVAITVACNYIYPTRTLIVSSLVKMRGNRLVSNMYA